MISQQNSFKFTQFTNENTNALTSLRQGETKLGETLCADPSKAKYLILGISEDIGPQSNGGFAGSTTAFSSFLKRFLNIQSNQFLSGESITVLGEITALASFENLQQGRSTVAELDGFVVSVLKPYVEKGMIPIVIGGGHNNAYPLIKIVSETLHQPIRIINFDPHADFRPLEGRHSGNPFSYAFHEGFMDFYAVMGLHQSYNSQFILDELAKHQMFCSFFDDYLAGKASFKQDLESFANKIQSVPFGIELDMDSIAYMPSSAFSPSGMTLEQARSYVIKMAQSPNVKYLHLPEAAPKNPVEEAVVGKALAYLVSDFIKANQ